MPTREVLARVVLTGAQKPRLALVLAIGRAFETDRAALRVDDPRQSHRRPFEGPVEGVLFVARRFADGREIGVAVLGRSTPVLTDGRPAVRPQAQRW